MNINEQAGIKGENIVIVGLQPWYTDIGSNCKSIALELARQNKVLYINIPLDRRTVLQQKDNPDIANHLAIIHGKGNDLVEVQPNLWNYYPHNIIESINWIPFTPVFSLLNAVNNRRFAADVKRAVKRMGFEKYILFNDNDIFRSFNLRDILKPDLYIYYSRDKLTGFDYWKKHGPAIEPKHIAKADLAVANSLYLQRYLAEYNKNSSYIGQGCNISLFNPDLDYETPADIAGLKGPIIGYVGAINSFRIDPEIIRVIAAAHPEWSIVMVGPEDDGFLKSDLHQIPNVYFPGKKAIPLLPAYINSFDVCINPQLINEITIGNYPLKIDEYLAMGKPTVASRTAAMEIFEGYAYMADSPAGYPALIEQAVREDTPARRQKLIALAKSHTWEQSVQLLYNAIIETRQRIKL